MELTNDELVDVFDLKNIAGSTIGYKIPPRTYGSSDSNLLIKSLLSNKVKVKIIIEDIRLR